MKLVSKTKKETPKNKPLFFPFRQTNSGGYYRKNEKTGVDQLVVFEAYSFEGAVSMLSIITDLNSRCSCCGDRWSMYKEGGFPTPTDEYGDELSKEIKYGPSVAYVHYLDGTLERWEGEDV